MMEGTMRTTGTVRILVVDDHPSFRRGVKDILEEGFEGASMAECGNAQEMLDHVREQPYDLVVMDISMPGNVPWTSMTKGPIFGGGSWALAGEGASRPATTRAIVR